MRSRSFRTTAVGILLCLVAPVGAAVARPPHADQIEVQSLTLRDSADDIALSDGAGPYASSDFSVTIQDLKPSTPDDDLTTHDMDFILLSTTFGGARHTFFNNILASTNEFGVGSTETIPCKSGYFFFESNDTPDFWEELQTVGASATGFATTGCYVTDTYRYHAAYSTGLGYCVVLTRSSETTLTLTAPAFTPLSPMPCLAQIIRYEKDDDGNFQGTSLGYSSAPFEATFDITQSGPGNGNGNAYGHSKGKGHGGGRL